MVLPQGAFENLEAGDVAGFDAAIAESQAATQAALQKPVQPAIAKNIYNDVKKDGKPEAATSKSKDGVPTKKGEPAKGAVVPDAEKPLIIENGMFDHLADEPIEDVRRFVGTSRPALPEQYIEMWDEGLEKDYLTFVANNQIPSRTAQRIMDWYAEVSIVSSNQSREWAIERFNETFSDLSKPMREKLIEFWLTDLLGDGEEE